MSIGARVHDRAGIRDERKIVIGRGGHSVNAVDIDLKDAMGYSIENRWKASIKKNGNETTCFDPLMQSVERGKNKERLVYDELLDIP